VSVTWFAQVEVRHAPRPDVTETDAGAGITSVELADRAAVDELAVRADELTRWLLDSGLSVEHDGLLEPTPLALELGELLSDSAA
jgi:hypothetical protein